MQKNTILYMIIVGLSGFIAGFVLANFLNRSDVNMLQAPADGSVASIPGAPGSADATLSPEEIRAKIAEADKNADNFTFQKDLGLALYRYGAMKQDDNILEESKRILERAAALNPKDFDVMVGLGNAEFDIGFYRKDAASLQKARETYAKALTIRPNDADVQTDMGISYFIQEPPAYDRAEAELKKVGVNHPRHERSLQFLVQVYTRQKRFADARAALDKLKSINPANPAIKELTSQVAAAEGGAS